MPTISFQKPRPKCSICGRRSHVITAANPLSPYLGCCALCGRSTAQLVEMLRVTSEPLVRELLARAIALDAAQQSAQSSKTAAV